MQIRLDFALAKSARLARMEHIYLQTVGQFCPESGTSAARKFCHS
jgi:hypothetical protein